MSKPKLSSSAGVFTGLTRTMLQEIDFDQSSTHVPIQSEPQLRIRHLTPLPDDLMLSASAFIQAIPIFLECPVQLRNHNSSKQHIFIPKKLEDIFYRFPILFKADKPMQYKPCLELEVFFGVRDRLSEKQRYLLSKGFDYKYLSDQDQKEFIQALYVVIHHYNNVIGSAKNKKQIRVRNRSLNNIPKVCTALFNSLIAKHSKILVVRIDFGFKRPHSDWENMPNAEDFFLSEHSISDFKNEMGKLIKSFRHNKNFKDAYYILKYEHGATKGFHAHGYFMWDGNKHHEDISLALLLKKKWETQTGGKGTAFICNMQKDKYQKCYLGMIHYSDHEKIQLLIDSFTYISKTEQLFLFRDFSNVRSFEHSQIPKKKSPVGRPRKSAIQHDQKDTYTMENDSCL